MGAVIEDLPRMEAPLPELLAPAGDREGLRAAVNFGADAVYLGLRGFNARARATNFDACELAEIVAEIRPRGVKVYVALNTLAFDGELARVAVSAEGAAAAGADALIVQDLGVARWIHEVCPELPLHASTQTSVGTAEGAGVLAELGFERLIAPRELDVDQLARLVAGAGIGVEAFVHGAHCLSWSGQCQASLARGGRSANRGRCAQPCRLPYRLEVDVEELARPGYPLSPTDLVGDAVVPALVDAGVCALKIEGRLKRPEYVAAAVRHYRRLLDRVGAGDLRGSTETERHDLLQPFTRTSTTGHLAGRDHRTFVDGERPGSLGLLVGEVRRVRGRTLAVESPRVPLKPGDGIAVMTDGEPVGGRLYGVEPVPGGGVELSMGREADLSSVRPGRRVWRTDDPALMKRLRQGIEGRSRDARPRRHPVSAVVRGAVGAPLELLLDDGEGHEVGVASAVVAEPARTRPLDPGQVEQRIGRLGQTPYRLASFVWEVVGEVALPLAEINRVRREACDTLSRARSVIVPMGWGEVPPDWTTSSAARVTPEGVYVLCRTPGQVEAAADGGAVAVVCEPGPFEGARPMLEVARTRGLLALAALPRTEAEGEPRRGHGDAAGVLVRTPGQLTRLGQGQALRVGDASLNAVNTPAVTWLLERGLDLVVPGRDLGTDGQIELCGSIDPQRLAIPVVERPPLFHTVHCLFAAHLADSPDNHHCGQACRGRVLSLRDDQGTANAVVGEMPCRNTVFGESRDRIDTVPALHAAGLRRFVVELVDEPPQVARLLVQRAVDARPRAAGGQSS